MGRSHSLPRIGASGTEGTPAVVGSDGTLDAARPPSPGSPEEAADEGCRILHVDMDAFFVAVEVRRDPSLAGRPVVVGGTGVRGVVSSASYEARKFGVHSAMPMGRARRLCPQAVFISPRHTDYGEVSRAVMAIFRDVTPLVEPLSLDEAFLDVSGAIRLLGRPAAIGRTIRARVQAEQGITCSVGVAPTKFVAKLASTRSKPNGLLVVPPDAVLPFLQPLPVSALWGVGERTGVQLDRLGLRTVGDLARFPYDSLRRTLGEALARHLHELSWGRDPRRVETHVPDKSIGAEETFDVDHVDPDVINRELLRLAETTAGRLRRSGQVGRTVVLKVRWADFSTISRSRTLGSPTDGTQEIYETARRLFEGIIPQSAVRLVGVRLEGISSVGSTSRQPELGEPEHGWADADRAVDAAAARFGRDIVRPATLLPAPGLRAGAPGSGPGAPGSGPGAPGSGSGAPASGAGSPGLRAGASGAGAGAPGSRRGLADGSPGPPERADAPPDGPGASFRRVDTDSHDIRSADPGS